jgi:hypothetical protein
LILIPNSLAILHYNIKEKHPSSPSKKHYTIQNTFHKPQIFTSPLFGYLFILLNSFLRSDILRITCPHPTLVKEKGCVIIGNFRRKMRCVTNSLKTLRKGRFYGTLVQIAQNEMCNKLPEMAWRR